MAYRLKNGKFIKISDNEKENKPPMREETEHEIAKRGRPPAEK